MKKRKLDFILQQDEDTRLVFRFYPRQSSCHSFNEFPPKSWNEVYKVYYAYSILSQWKDNKDDIWHTEIVFEESCDECSVIDEVGSRIEYLMKDQEVFEREYHGEKHIIQLLDDLILPFGMGTSWEIHKNIRQPLFDNETEEIISYRFTLFDYWNKGYQFVLSKEKTEEFGKYLLDCCEYMLQHGCGI